jgi:CheY-like chemotaxis protein
MSTILLAGSDYRLLETRAAVLAKTGAEVISRNSRETLEILGRDAFDLVILCHSLPELDAAVIVAKVHEKSPATKILMVTSNLDMFGTRADSEVDATSFPEPGQLIALASQLLKNGSSARPGNIQLAAK